MVATLGAGSLVVQRLDRYSRDPLTAALAEAELRRNGASLACADGTGGGDDPTSELIRGILLAVARFEKALIRARIKAALAVKRSRGSALEPHRYVDQSRGEEPRGSSRRDSRDATAPGASLCGAVLRAVIDQATLAEGLRNRAGKPFTLAAVHKLVKDAA